MNDTEQPPSADAAQAKIELLLDEASDAAGCLIAQLEAALAMRAAHDVTGFIYSLRHI